MFFVLKMKLFQTNEKIVILSYKEISVIVCIEDKYFLLSYLGNNNII